MTKSVLITTSIWTRFASRIQATACMKYKSPRYAACWKATASTRTLPTGWRRRASATGSITDRKHSNEQTTEDYSQYCHRVRGSDRSVGDGRHPGCANGLVPELCQAENYRVHGGRHRRAGGDRFIPVRLAASARLRYRFRDSWQ